MIALHLYYLKLWNFVVIWCCFCSVTKSRLTFATPGTAAHQPSLSFTISWEFAQTHVLWVVMPSNYLILCCPLLFLPTVSPSIKVFSEKLALCIRRPKNWSFKFSISPSNEYSGLISFRTDWFDVLAGQGTLKSLLQRTTVRKHHFFSALPPLWSKSHIRTWLLKNP